MSQQQKVSSDQTTPKFLNITTSAGHRCLNSVCYHKCSRRKDTGVFVPEKLLMKLLQPYCTLKQPSQKCFWLVLRLFCCVSKLLLTPYNGCIVAKNINTSITCLIVQSKNGVGFNPCHLSLPTDLKLAHWTAVAHAHRTVKHKHLIYSLVDFRSLYSFRAIWDHGFGQLVSSRVLLHHKYFQELVFFNISMQPAFQMVGFPDQNQSQ